MKIQPHGSYILMSRDGFDREFAERNGILALRELLERYDLVLDESSVQFIEIAPDAPVWASTGTTHAESVMLLTTGNSL